MFYENFTKKIDSYDLKEKSVYKYSMNLRKKILWTISGTVMFIIALFSFYSFYIKPSAFVLLMGLALLFMSGTFVWSMFSYKLTVDKENGIMVLKNNEIKIDEIETAVLKLMVPPGKKYLEPCIDVITQEKVRIILPLIMGKKAEFAKLMKSMLKERFSVEKM